MQTLSKQSLAAALAAALVFACGSGDKQAQSPSSTQSTASTSVTADPAAQGYGSQHQQQAQIQASQPQPQQQPMTGAGGPADTMTGDGTQSTDATSTTTTTQAAMDTKKVTTLSDGDILGIENALDSGQIKLAELARKKAQHAQVKTLAGTIVAKHRDAQTKAKGLAQKNSITAKDGDVSNKLKTDVTSAESDLKNKKGRDFDASYVDSLVRMHTEAVDILDNQLLPSAKNDALKDHLQTVRGFVSDHLSKAQEIQSSLGAVGTTSTTGDTGRGKAKGGTRPKDMKPDTTKK
jgi:putative membrane protein